MSHYKHLTPEEREIILILYSYHCTIQFIADCIERDRSTIYRELKRNTIHRNIVDRRDDRLRKRVSRAIHQKKSLF